MYLLQYALWYVLKERHTRDQALSDVRYLPPQHITPLIPARHDQHLNQRAIYPTRHYRRPVRPARKPGAQLHTKNYDYILNPAGELKILSYIEYICLTPYLTFSLSG